jgi:thioesterase domain-containing protein
MVEHRGLCSLAVAEARTIDIGTGSRVLQCASFSFDACAFEIIMALCNGASLHLPATEAVLAGSILTRALDQHGITHALLTPAVLAALPENANLSGVRTLVVGGDKCTPELVRRWAPGRRLINAYGPTEATICATLHHCHAEASGGPPIGRPIANARTYLLDRRGLPVPVGVEGEIYIGGVGVARGYLNKVALTAERFVSDPFVSEAGARMYRTGDMGRYLPDGTLEFLGRNDQQVKIRGFRIELGEIEARLQQQPGIGAVAVVAREYAPGDRRLVAYYTLAESEAVGRDAASLRSHLVASLPEYMVPVAYVRLESLPLTPNGKLDRMALPAPEGVAFGSCTYEAPVGEIEIGLAQIWSILLCADRVGRRDNFFALGGHSLLIIQMIERLHQLGLQADVSAIYNAPTLEALASQTYPLSPLVSEHVIAFRSGSSRRPLFLLHETSGEVLSYEPLSRCLGDGLPIYGLRADRDAAEGVLTVETLADRYLSVIRRIQPEGPYRLAGWSGGGLIAYEMARQLLNTGERVEFLGMIDSRAINSTSSVELPTQERLKWVFVYHRLRSLQPDLAESRMSELLLLGNVDIAMDHCRQAGWLPPDFAEELSWRNQRTQNLYRAFCSYRPQRVSIPVHLLNADIPDGADPSQGWQAVVGDGLRIEPIGGTHDSIMEEPYVQKLATVVACRLADIEAAVGT